MKVLIIEDDSSIAVPTLALRFGNFERKKTSKPRTMKRS